MGRIEETKVAFELELLPSLRELTRRIVESARQQTAVESPLGNSGAVLDAADRLLEQSSRAISIASKFVPIAQALAMLFTGHSPFPAM